MTDKEKEMIFLLAQKLTGAHPDGTFQHGVFITNVEKRMRATKITNVADYLNFAKDNKSEHAHLISALSIHTTSWFRENPHYVVLQKAILKFAESQKTYRVWSCACSTGEEVYSLALLFEEFRSFHNKFDYRIVGTDIDPVSVESARRAIYDQKYLQGPVSFYKKHILLGSGPTENLFTFTKELRDRCEFKAHDVRKPLNEIDSLDLIVCRNILIYFPSIETERIVADLVRQLKPGGLLILGHSEMINYQKLGLVLRGHSVYEKPAQRAPMTVTDDSLRSTSEKWKAQVRQKEASDDLTPAQKLRDVPKRFKPELIVIGASTGGPQALSALLTGLDENTPPTIVIQHISSQFAHGFAQTLSENSGLKLGLSKDNCKLQKGHLYVCESDCHLTVERIDNELVLRQSKKPPINGHRPSIDYLFSSADCAATHTVAILLSGMGHDGAEGMRKLHDNGAYTFAQSETDCVVFGMPKEAIELKAVDYIGSAKQIRNELLEIIRRQQT